MIYIAFFLQYLPYCIFSAIEYYVYNYNGGHYRELKKEGKPSHD